MTTPARAWMRLLGSCGVFPGLHVTIKWFGMQGKQSDRGEMRERDDTDALTNAKQILQARWNVADKGFDKSQLCLE